ncbi:MAG: YkgJ family cysteine cluster protein [Nanoarchaeota archaeon]|nr:YkgJ family cysteine cluster protein [Nanoarchaeota archaeon]
MNKEEEFLKALEEWKDKTLSPYCLDECTKFCCNLESIPLIEEELIRVLGKEPEDFSSHQHPDNPEIFIFKGICPQYEKETRQCQIRDERPKACRNYPFVVQFFGDLGLVGVTEGCQYFNSFERLKQLEEQFAQYSVTVSRIFEKPLRNR